MNPEVTIVQVDRHLAAAPEKVFAAFANPALVSRWLKPAPEITLSVLEFDFREGGSYRFAYHVPNGQVIHVAGTYQSIKRPAKIVFSWIIEPPDEHAGLRSEVTVTLAPDGLGTALRIRHERLSLPGAMARHAEGWAGALDQLASLVVAPAIFKPPQGTDS